MFEDSTFESMGIIRTRSRGWMLATFTLNGSILLALVLFPLIYPRALPDLSTPIPMIAPAPLAEEPKPLPVPAHATIASPQFHLNDLQAPSVIPKNRPLEGVSEVSRTIDLGTNDSMGTGTGSADNPWSEHPPVVVAPPPKAPVPVSLGVMNGLLYQMVRPVYPAIAQQIRAEGTVVLQAAISKNGTIENLHVVSGPALLRQAALDAVRQWRYRPYLLNGQPVEVETTVNVVFKLN